jgi:DMSO/TMAO reductase YedYZ molybdopterin-dependent catalytic subunit
MMVDRERSRAGIAGVVAAGLALGVGELLAGVVSAVPSPISAVGGYVVDHSPPFVKDFAIAVFGTADKGALAVGTVVIALAAGWGAGLLARRRLWAGLAIIVWFGVLGLVAGLGEPRAEAVPVTAATLVAAGVGMLGLWVLLGSAGLIDPGGTRPGDAGRRRFLWLAGAGGALALGTGVAGRRLLSGLPDLPAVTLPEPSRPVSPPGPEHGFAGPEGITPIVVPNDDFYRIDTALVVPRVSADDWRLRLTGRVGSELSFTYAELIDRALVEEYVTIACVSNEVGGDLIGNARWGGVRLVEILEEADVDRDGTQLVGRSVDGWTAGFPTELAFDGREPLLALTMNGEPLPRRHGYPARLIVPGLYGYVSATKWLEEIEITGWDEFDAYWVPRGWAKQAPIKTQSRIDVPRRGAAVSGSPLVVAGVAWAPTVGIERVEVRIDEGEWEAADLTEPLSSAAWVQWRAELPAEPGERRIWVRATDGSGTVQTGDRRAPRPDGATGHHMVPVTVR